MTTDIYFPINIKKLILEYCDDRVEKRQKYYKSKLIESIKTISKYYNILGGKNIYKFLRDNDKYLLIIKPFLYKEYYKLQKELEIIRKERELVRIEKKKKFRGTILQFREYKKLRRLNYSILDAMESILNTT
jgi:hypothetical protein